MPRRLVIDLELTEQLEPLLNLAGWDEAQLLVRLHGRPVGSSRVAIRDGTLDRAAAVRQAIIEHRYQIGALLAHAALSGVVDDRVDVATLAARRPTSVASNMPVTVAVCTRDRTSNLAPCLDALIQLAYTNVDILVVDNAPSSDATRHLVAGYAGVRYVREPRPGLNWARNRAIQECKGDILAFTDDDVVVDCGWVSSLIATFEADPSAMAVTGLVVPLELQTAAQLLFEAYGGFGRGFERRWFRARPGRAIALELGGAGAFGTGANMAYRRRVFDLVGGFDPALDVGTVTHGGGDLEMFFRVLKHGHTLVYDPTAIVRHRHRSDYRSLQVQITNNGTGFYAYLARTAAAYRDERLAVLRLGEWWFRWWSLRRLLRKLAWREDIPLDLICRELVGSLRGPIRYRSAQRRAKEVVGKFRESHMRSVPVVAPPAVQQGEREAVRRVDVSEPLRPIADVEPFRRVHLFVFWRGRPLGRLQIDNRGRSISIAELRDAISRTIPQAILDPAHRVDDDVFWCDFARRLQAWRDGRATHVEPNAARGTLPVAVSVSVVVATRDRPDELHACLTSLTTQRTERQLEIIVVDNHPVQSATAAVAARFPGVRLVSEPRPGLSYARNRGILAATGSLVLTTDDDVVCDADWVERLVAPFARPEVMVVTGNVLPLELETAAQQHFEMYGGLGRGYSAVEFDGDWMRRCRRSVPTWELGCTASAAFRASIFSDPRIGLMDESLGAGTPTGCSEDTLAFYRVLRAGHTIVYEPSAFVWHRHRRTMAALRHQLYSYSKGHVAYHLLTLLEHGDHRALVRLGFELPLTYAVRLWRWVCRRSDYPLPFILHEIRGNLAGPWALWRSCRRVRRFGRTPLKATKDVEERSTAFGRLRDTA